MDRYTVKSITFIGLKFCCFTRYYLLAYEFVDIVKVSNSAFSFYIVLVKIKFVDQTNLWTNSTHEINEN